MAWSKWSYGRLTFQGLTTKIAQAEKNKCQPSTYCKWNSASDVNGVKGRCEGGPPQIRTVRMVAAMGSSSRCRADLPHDPPMIPARIRAQRPRASPTRSRGAISS